MAVHVHRKQLAMFAAGDPSVLAQAAERIGVASPPDELKVSLARRLCDQFNERYHVGAAVVYRPRRTRVTYTVTVARPARVNAAGDAVVELTGVSGGVALGEIEAPDPNSLEGKQTRRTDP